MNPNITIYCFDADTREKYQQELSKQKELYYSKITWFDSPEQEANEKDICFYIVTGKRINLKACAVILCGNLQENIRHIVNELYLHSGQYNRPIKPLEAEYDDIIELDIKGHYIYKCNTWCAISDLMSSEGCYKFRWSDIDPDYWIQKDTQNNIFYYKYIGGIGLCFIFKYDANTNNITCYDADGNITTQFNKFKQFIRKKIEWMIQN